MKWLLIFLLPVLFSCTHRSVRENTIATPGNAAIDTAVGPVDYEHFYEFVLTNKTRDSFLSIKPIYTFREDKSSLPEDQVVAMFIDTAGLEQLPVIFTEKEDRKYDKEQMPVKQTMTYKGGPFTVKVITDKFEEPAPKRIFINGRRLLPGKNIDTTLISNNFIEWLELYPDQLHILKYKHRMLLYMKGTIEKCNGTGCGVNYHFLYDPVLHKAMGVEDYRVSNFYTGITPGTNEINFLRFEPFEYNSLYNIIPFSAQLYSFSGKGKVSPVKNVKGEHCYFDGYMKNGSADIRIIKAALPLRP